MGLTGTDTIILDFEVIKSNNCKKLIVLDISEYAFLPAEQDVYLSIIIPGYQTPKEFIIPRNQANVFNAYTLGLSDDPETTANLPDGIYQITLKTCPFDELYVSKYHLRNCEQKCKLNKQFVTLDLLCDDCMTVKQRNLLHQIELLINASEAHTELCNVQKAMQMYQKANELLKEVSSDGDCHGCH